MKSESRFRSSAKCAFGEEAGAVTRTMESADIDKNSAAEAAAVHLAGFFAHGCDLVLLFFWRSVRLSGNFREVSGLTLLGDLGESAGHCCWSKVKP